MQEYEFKVEYITGEKNGADGLSRYCKRINVEQSPESTNTEKMEIIKAYHSKSGHGSSNTMKFLMLSKYKWKDIIKDIENFCKECVICARADEARQNTKNRVLEVNRSNEL